MFAHPHARERTTPRRWYSAMHNRRASKASKTKRGYRRSIRQSRTCAASPCIFEIQHKMLLISPSPLSSTWIVAICTEPAREVQFRDDAQPSHRATSTRLQLVLADGVFDRWSRSRRRAPICAGVLRRAPSSQGNDESMACDGIGAGGGTRTHTTLPSRDFKSLASTSSATSAPLFHNGFQP